MIRGKPKRDGSKRRKDDLCQWESEVSIKGLNFEDTLRKYLEHASYGARLENKTKVPKFRKNPKKAKSEADVGPKSA